MQMTRPDRVGLSKERLARIDPIMQGYVDRGQVAGMSTLIARKGQIAQQGFYGWADAENQRHVTPETIWRVYSMTKPVTAAAALILHERGLFTLNDPVGAYIPAFAGAQVLVGLSEAGPQTVPAEREITIRDLFRHTAGLTYGWGEGDIDRVYKQGLAALNPQSGVTTTAEFVDAIGALPLAYHPGRECLYSLSIDVLGRLVEVVSGKRFGQFLLDELFEPLGMLDTAFYVPEEKQGRLAQLYDVKDGLKPLEQQGFRDYLHAPKLEMGGGGLVSTLGDYARFAQMLASGGELDGARILGRKTVELMGRNHLTPQQQTFFTQRLNRRGYGYGLGVRVMVDLAAASTAGSLGEFGWDGAASTWFCVDPAEQMIAVLMIQMMPIGHYPIATQFQALAYQALT